MKDPRIVLDHSIAQAANTLSLVALAWPICSWCVFAGCGRLAGCSASSALGEPTPQDQSCQFLCHWHWSKWQRCSICCCKQWTRPCRRCWHTPPMGCRCVYTTPPSAFRLNHIMHVSLSCTICPYDEVVTSIIVQAHTTRYHSALCCTYVSSLCLGCLKIASLIWL